MHGLRSGKSAPTHRNRLALQGRSVSGDREWPHRIKKQTYASIFHRKTASQARNHLRPSRPLQNQAPAQMFPSKHKKIKRVIDLKDGKMHQKYLTAHSRAGGAAYLLRLRSRTLAEYI